MTTATQGAQSPPAMGLAVLAAVGAIVAGGVAAFFLPFLAAVLVGYASGACAWAAGVVRWKATR